MESADGNTISSFLKKAKKPGAKGRIFSKFTTRFFVLDIRNQVFYYQKKQNSRKPEKTYSLDGLIGIESNPQVIDRCNWKFPFKLTFKSRVYMLHAEAISVQRKWVEALRRAKGRDGSQREDVPIQQPDPFTGQIIGTTTEEEAKMDTHPNIDDLRTNESCHFEEQQDPPTIQQEQLNVQSPRPEQIQEPTSDPQPTTDLIQECIPTFREDPNSIARIKIYAKEETAASQADDKPSVWEPVIEPIDVPKVAASALPVFVTPNTEQLEPQQSKGMVHFFSEDADDLFGSDNEVTLMKRQEAPAYRNIISVPPLQEVTNAQFNQPQAVKPFKPSYIEQPYQHQAQDWSNKPSHNRVYHETPVQQPVVMQSNAQREEFDWDSWDD